MAQLTGIELGPDRCLLVCARAADGGVAVSGVHDGDSAGAADLKRIRRQHRLPRHARVVLWGMPAGADASDARVSGAPAPVLEAGFTVDAVISPADALTLVARQRRVAGAPASAWVAVARHGAALAIVSAGQLTYSREIAWRYRPPSTTRDELLQRYTFVAQLASEIRHGMDVARRQHGANVDSIVTCGDLPDLRSLTMPLIEELDDLAMEVETLDGLEGLAMDGSAGRWSDRAPALRLACAAVADAGVEPSRLLPRTLAAAAAIAALAIGYAGYTAWSARPREAASGPVTRADTNLPAPPAQQASPPAHETPAAATPEPAPKPAPAAAPVQELPPAEPVSAEGPRPQATTGRRGASGGGQPDSGRQDDLPAPVARRAAPLPVVNSILVAPDRRLAVLDGAIVREGERVGGRTVLAIEPAAVVLREADGEQVRVPIRRRVADGVR